ncbi:biotin/lipoyl-binding protein, partial [Chloroflexota bacterium]
IFYQEATVEQVLVEEGDTVEQGQVLARLDEGEWEDNLGELQDKLTAAERGLTAKGRALASVERQITAKEFAVRQAQLNLQTAEYNLGQIADVKKAQDAVDNAEYALKFAKSMLTGELGGGYTI